MQYFAFVARCMVPLNLQSCLLCVYPIMILSLAGLKVESRSRVRVGIEYWFLAVIVGFYCQIMSCALVWWGELHGMAEANGSDRVRSMWSW